MAAPEISESLAALDATMASIEQVIDLPKLVLEIADLEAQASVPNLWDDQAHAQVVTSRLSFLQSELARARTLRVRLDDLAVMLELAEAEDDVDTLAEVEVELASLTTTVGELEVRTLLSGEYDSREALITIRAEAGGVDAADWAEMLLRMYTRYCERHGWPFEVYDTSYAEEAGIKSATFAVKVPFAYGTLSVEQGTHRLV
ncbi:MAG: PCRF domain-containing protein, partial [Actinobacteria bacterium]|nr:PCRF domain-containing protein [Actinomycetota bacterium]